MADKTKLQRKILLTAYDNPKMTQAEIARQLNCSSSYVSQVLNRYDGQDAMEARIEELNSQLGIGDTGGVFGASNESTRPEDSINTEVPEVEGNLEDVGPLGALIIAAVVGGYLLLSDPFSGSFSTVRWGIIAACVFVVCGVIFYLYTIYQKDGLSAAVSTAFGGSETGEKEGKSPEDDTPAKSPPAPKSLKDELYFDRAEQECEWCEDHVDQPEVHHIEPRSEGGPNTAKNLIVLCPNCHRKADRGGISQSKLKTKVRRQIG